MGGRRGRVRYHSRVVGAMDEIFLFFSYSSFPLSSFPIFSFPLFAVVKKSGGQLKEQLFGDNGVNGFFTGWEEINGDMLVGGVAF